MIAPVTAIAIKPIGPVKNVTATPASLKIAIKEDTILIKLPTATNIGPTMVKNAPKPATI